MSADVRISDVIPAIAAALGAPLSRDPGWPLPQAESYVVVLVDGMGDLLVREHPDQTPFLRSLDALNGVSEIPSTTATSLTSFGTALRPGEHGVVGFTSRIPGTDRLLNALDWPADVDAEAWQPLPTAFEQLVACGITTSVVGPAAYASSGLTRAAQRGARYLPADRFGERLAHAVTAAAVPGSFTYVYDGDLDALGHRHGVDSSQWRAQLRLIDAGLDQLCAALPRSTRLVITADHGMVDVARERQFDVDMRPDLRAGVLLMGGEARFRHLYCADGEADAVLARWRAAISEDDAIVAGFEEAHASGWFGPVSERVRARIGDVLVASTGDFAVMSSKDHPREQDLIGLHGSITDRERRIPVLIA